MVSVCTVPARGGRSCEHFGGYKTINRIPLPLLTTKILAKMAALGIANCHVLAIVLLVPNALSPSTGHEH